jgi:hypothetical protein
MPKSPDDLEGLKTERAAADRVYNDALTRLDAAIRAFPHKFPASPPAPDVHQLSSLNTRWKITTPPAEPGIRGRFAAAVRRIVAPLFDQQEAFNGALVDHLNRNVPVQLASGESLDAGLTVLGRFQTLLIVFLQQITPYVDTRDRDVAGLLRGLSGAIDAVSNELLKRSEALLARDYQHDRRLSEMEVELRDLRAHLAELQERAAHERPASSPPR